MARAVRAGTRADALLLAACAFLSLLAMVLPARHRDPVAAALRRSLLAPLVQLQRSAEVSRAAFLTHDAATMVADSLALRAMSLASLENENERLRKLLGLGGQLRWGFVPAEALHGRGLGPEHTITLTAGAKTGIRKYSPVIAPEGLVGMVESVDPSMSLAILYTHPDFRVSAMATDGGAFGIVRAHLGSGASRYLLELSGVPFRSKMDSGAVIVSSGLGGTFPRGIPIGTVMREIQTTEAWARTYLVRPAVLPADISSVMVLLPQRVATGVADVWSTSRAADSATRSLVAGADSLARNSQARATGAVPPTVPTPSVTPAPIAPPPQVTQPARRDTVRPAQPPPVRDTTRREPQPRPDTLFRIP
jgi:rod shape-determining protein MreC